MVPHITRRTFLVAAGSATAAVAFAGCGSAAHEIEAESRPRLAEDVVAGYESWYATACGGCGAGCGAIVRVIDGRAKKLEGNPDHPVNAGKLCARGQAVVQRQYHPDRVRGPMTRSGARGQAAFSSATWEEGLNQLGSRLRSLQQAGRGSAVALLTGPLSGHRAAIAGRFASGFGARWLTLDTTDDLPLREAARRVLGQEGLPVFDLQNARYVLSFGADFLSGWLSPVRFGIEYGIFRQGQYGLNGFAPAGRPRGHLVQVEPRFSMTAANADEWLPVTPGREGLLALALAQVIVSENLGDTSAAGALGGSLEAFSPDAVAGDTGITADRIRQVARDFASHKPALAIAGGSAGAHTNGSDVLAGILALNALVGSLGQQGGLRAGAPWPPASPPSASSTPAAAAAGSAQGVESSQGLAALSPARAASAFSDWQSLIDDMRAGRIDTVVVHGANPVHELPASMGFRDALAQVPFVASLSSFQDETSAYADLLLPSHLPLEDWGDDVAEPAPIPTITIQQPVVSPLFDTRPLGDTLTQLAGEAGMSLPWANMQEAVRDGARALQQLNRGSLSGDDPERFWTILRQRGGWWDTSAQPPAASIQTSEAASAIQSLAGAWKTPDFAGGEQDFPYYLLPFEHITFGAGEGASDPWLQATPDPVTTVVWSSWVELNPGVARGLEVKEGDLLRLESPLGAIELPAYISPAAPPHVLAVPMGQGHSALGRWAGGRGANPMAILAPLTDGATGALAYAATRVRLTKTGRHMDLPKFEGTVPAYQIPKKEVLKVVER